MPKFIKRSELKNDKSGQALRKSFTTEIKVHADDSRKVDFIISTSSVDRDGDTIDVSGWEVSNFIKNPVVLFGHDYRSLPVGKASNLRFEDGNFIATVEFVAKEISTFAESVFQMVKQKFLRATSVGFEPIEWKFTEDEGRNGIDFLKQELLEFSIVPVPSNPDALLLASSNGIDIAPIKSWAQEILEGSKTPIWLPKSVLKKLIDHTNSKGDVQIYVPHEEKGGKIFDLDGNLVVDKKLEQLKNASAWSNENNHKLLHHDVDTGDGDVNVTQVKIAMKNLLDLPADCACIPVTDYKDVYDHLAEHYDEFGLTSPEFKYVQSQVLKYLPDDFKFNDDTGTLERSTEEPETKEVSIDEIADMTKDLATKAINKILGKLD